MSKPLGNCEIQGCGTGLMAYVVSKDFHFLKVCRSCMTEMLGLYGWTLLPAGTAVVWRGPLLRNEAIPVGS